MIISGRHIMPVAQKTILRVQKKGNIEFFGVVVGMIQMWTIYQLLLDILKSQDTKITLLDLGWLFKIKFK